MGIFDGFAEGLASAVDDIRHTYEQSMYGQQTTGNIELPQVEAPTIEAPATSTGAYQEPNSNIVNVTNATVEQGWGVAIDTIDQSWSHAPITEPPIEPTTWAQAAQGIEAPQIEAPQPTQEMER